MKKNNLKEFVDLIKLYKAVTLEEIKNINLVKKAFINKAQMLTGYGDPAVCTLCVSSDTCDECAWRVLTNHVCYDNRKNGKTYNAISNAKTDENLLKAFKSRAKHMKKVLRKKILNFKAFKELIKHYESITIKDIVNVEDIRKHCNVATQLTGFGDTSTCSLCVDIDRSKNCKGCAWVMLTGSQCNLDKNGKTYNAIYFAKSDKSLLKAFKKRAKYIRKILF